jgi:integrase
LTSNLTGRTVDALKPRAAKFYVSDAPTPGLALLVTPSGSKSWSVRYRIGRRLRRLTLGRYPVLSLADARQRAKDALKLVADDVDPALVKQERRDADTVGAFAETYIEKHAKPRKKSWKIDRMRLTKDVLPAWQHRLMKDITRRDVRELLDTIAARPAPIVANRVRSLLHKLFNVAIELEVVETNPVTATRRPGVEHGRDRVANEDELRALWKSFDVLEPKMAAFYKLRLLTVQRGGEVASMRWQDVDLEAGWWTIPSGASKNRLAHRVPLAATALGLIAEILATSKPHTSYVLEGARGKRQQAQAAATFTVEDFRGHDLRRTAASVMAGAGIPRLTISKILNHVERSVTAVYDRHSYDAEKRGALDWWDAKLQAILDNTGRAQVLPFARS